MSDAKISREEAQAEIDGLLVAEIIRDAQVNFRGVYGHYVFSLGVGPIQSLIGLSIKRGHLSVDQAAELARLRAKVDAADKLAEAVTGLVSVLDQNETKGPISEVQLMFCWMAAQDVRAAARGAKAK